MFYNVFHFRKYVLSSYKKKEQILENNLTNLIDYFTL